MSLSADGAAFDRLVAAVGRDATRAMAPGIEGLVAELRRRFGGGVAGVLFYGSCLRAGTLDGIVDVYVLVDGYRAVYGSRWLALANRILPPNVFFVAATTNGSTVRAKVAVMAMAQFAAGCGPRALLPTVWGRFCQPVALVYARDERVRAAIHRMLAEAVVTAFREGVALAAHGTDPWRAVLAASYRAELRAEGAGRAEAIVAADEQRYARLTPLALAVAAGRPGGVAWPWAIRRVVGKAINVLRLMKAAFTFEGGVDYLAWKIERHTGVVPDLSPWQRRHPLLALPWVALRLYRQGVLR